MKKQTFAQRTRANFLTGLILVLPIGITFYLVWATVTFIDDIIVPLLPEQLTPNGVFAQNIPGFGVIFFILALTLIGALAKGFIGRQIIRLGESLVGRTPVIRGIYNAVKQIAETVFNQNNQLSKSIQDCDEIICTGLNNAEEEIEIYDRFLKENIKYKKKMICANPDEVVSRGTKLEYCAGKIGQIYSNLGG